MEKTYCENQTFAGINFSLTALPATDFENCYFNNCDFHGSNLSGLNFSTCKFNSCDLSLAMLDKTAFRDVTFIDSKLLGLHFANCNSVGFAVKCDHCILTLSSFYKIKLKGTAFKNCNLQESDFSESDLTNALFENCDLAGCVFDHTNLEKADFRTSFNYTIDPERNKIKKAKFSEDGIAGLLHKYDINIERPGDPGPGTN